MPWSSGAAPSVELHFQTEEQRFWRVHKMFGKGGSSELDESRNGQDFEEAERGRKVDGRLRALLGWGVSEPGGSGAARGVPKSFLATVLLSTQTNVDSVLGESLEADQDPSGKDQIAAALQAVSQDPLFVDLLRTVQTKRDEAYTPGGARSHARGSAFKTAADRVNTARQAMESLQHIVSASEAAEHQVRERAENRDRRQRVLDEAREKADVLEALTTQTAHRAVAEDAVRVAQEDVQRIQRIDVEIALSEQGVARQRQQADEAERALAAARMLHTTAQTDLTLAEKEVRQHQADPGLGDTVARQGLELRRLNAQQSVAQAERDIIAVGAVQALIDDAARRSDELAVLQDHEAALRQSSLRHKESPID